MKPPLGGLAYPASSPTASCPPTSNATSHQSLWVLLRVLLRVALWLLRGPLCVVPRTAPALPRRTAPFATTAAR
ncbi:hypothetical protein [Streptomyces sp. NPDC093097]|uniref:hypothetical protein n=1 Tax=Streptomyces sp. NPDC093097 TaxID=3366027 RepID=UPI00382DBBC9